MTPQPSSDADTARHEAAGGPATHSLRRRLLWFVLAAILLAALLQGTTAYRGALQQADDMFDYHLQQMAYSLRGGIPLVPAQPGNSNIDDLDFIIQIWGQDGAQLFRSERSGLPPRAVLGFSDVTVNGTSYRVYSVQTPLHTIQIAQDMSARQARARALALRATLPIALMAPLLMLAVGWVISRSFAPVERTRRQVAARAAEDLSPLPDTGLPDEVRPLVQELNLLFGRVRTAFEAQKHFVADAAHELRSPLTALKLQAQALRRADDAGTRDAAVARLNQGIDRAIRLVEQLLVLARAEAGGETAQDRPVDLQEVVRLAVSDVLPQAQAAGIDLGLMDDSPAGPVVVQGQSEALRVLLRNLLDNAIKYTPVPGRVDVGLHIDGTQARLMVDDSGPGIAEPERERVFDRFYRAHSPDAAPAATGSGLGLAIVQAIAQQHGAALRLERSPSLGGLRVEVRLALSAPAATATR
ncbi:ATP-binding protein [Variovorax terrae]|uniref:histidine kinase n=1 Tax=Variovorax terrae TaxID=2923278 RepID=A0A9X1VV37_9BURK|nr:ATP-binding protein [Variovorax terrae]MCJ0764356.1 ATP-binding protein [Variovorax terrae]